MSRTKEETRALGRLALPIIGTNLGTMMLSTVDTIMVGHLNDARALAAAALANVWIHGTSMFAMGILFGMDPIVTRAHGAKDGERAGLAFQRGIVLAVIVGLVVAALWTFTEAFLILFDQEAETARLAHEYTIVQVWTVPFFMLFVAMRQYLQGRGILKPALVVVLLANVFNFAANRVLIFGALGIPAMGVQGAGVATMLTRLMMFGALAWLLLRHRLHANAWVPWSRRAFSPRGLGELLAFGIPTGFQLCLEIWAFGYAQLMAGELGAVSAATHAIVLNMAAFTFMVPMGVSFAAVTRVGNLIGEGRPGRAQVAGWMAFAMSASFMALAAVFFLSTGTFIPSQYTQDPEILALAAAIIPIAAAFQVFDGTQVAGCGVLRGMGKTLPAAWINLLGYWVLALPLARWMAFERGLGLRGVWWGLAIALAIVALCLVAYVHWRGPARSSGVAAPQRTS